MLALIGEGSLHVGDASSCGNASSLLCGLCVTRLDLVRVTGLSVHALRHAHMFPESDSTVLGWCSTWRFHKACGQLA